MNEPLVRARGLHKSFASGAGTIHVLRGLDLEVAAGEAVAVVGDSGVGKSTLLHRAASGMIPGFPPHLKVPRSHLALQGPPTPTLRWPLFLSLGTYSRAVQWELVPPGPLASKCMSQGEAVSCLCEKSATKSANF